MRKAGALTNSSGLTSKQRYDLKRRKEQGWRGWYNTARWREIRARVLAEQPICRICQKARSQVVDHIEKHGGDRRKFFAGPFWGLCKACHDSHKQRWEKGNSRPIGPDGWPTN